MTDNHPHMIAFISSLTEEQESAFVSYFIDVPNDRVIEFLEMIRARRKANAMNILNLVADVWELEPNQIQSESRNEVIVMSRAHLYKFLSVYCEMSYEKIGLMVGKDHSTVSHAINHGFAKYSSKYTIFVRNWEKVRKKGLDLLKQTSIEP